MYNPLTCNHDHCSGPLTGSGDHCPKCYLKGNYCGKRSSGAEERYCTECKLYYTYRKEKK